MNPDRLGLLSMPLRTFRYSEWENVWGQGTGLDGGATGRHEVRGAGTSCHVALSAQILRFPLNAGLISCCSKQWGAWLLEASAEQPSGNISFLLLGRIKTLLGLVRTNWVCPSSGQAEVDCSTLSRTHAFFHEPLQFWRLRLDALILSLAM